MSNRSSPVSSRLEKLSTLAVLVAALAVGAAALHREFGPEGSSAATATSVEPRFVDSWESLLATGIRLGDSTAPVKLIEFTDLECAFCGQFHESLTALRRRSADMEYILVHSPLPQHRFAIPAARALECAARQDRTDAMLSALFAKQDSFGLRSWQTYARDAAVEDMEVFESCIESTAGFERIDAGIAAAQRVRIPGTPTFLINGWLYSGVGPDSLESEVNRRAAELRE